MLPVLALVEVAVLTLITTMVVLAEVAVPLCLVNTA